MINNKIRIAVISTTQDPFMKVGGEEAGGIQLYVRYLCKKLAERNFDVDVFTRRSDPTAPKIRKKDGFRVLRIHAGEVKFIPRNEIHSLLPEFTDKTLNFIKKEGSYDLVHSHYWPSGPTAIALKEKLGLPFVHTIHSLGATKHRIMGQHNEKTEDREKLETEIVRKSDATIVESEDEKNEVLAYCAPEAKNLHIIPAGVALDKFYFCYKSIAKKRLGTKVKNIVLYAGRFEERKGLMTLMQAMKLLIERLPTEELSTKLLIVGGDPNLIASGVEQEELKKITEYISENKLNRFIEFVGRVPNHRMRTYYSAADVCVVPSYYEPFGIVPIEAMACGTPVVASRVGGMQYTIKDGITGLLASPKDPEDFANKIMEILVKEDLKREMISNSIANVNKQFSWDSVTTDIIKLYNSILGMG